jgi:hypothetical protein
MGLVEQIANEVQKGRETKQKKRQAERKHTVKFQEVLTSYLKSLPVIHTE